MRLNNPRVYLKLAMEDTNELRKKSVIEKVKIYIARAEAIGKLAIENVGTLTSTTMALATVTTTTDDTAFAKLQRSTNLKMRTAKQTHEQGRYFVAKDLYIECADNFLLLAKLAPNDDVRQKYKSSAESVIVLAERMKAASVTQNDEALPSVGSPSAIPARVGPASTAVALKGGIRFSTEELAVLRSCENPQTAGGAAFVACQCRAGHRTFRPRQRLG